MLKINKIYNMDCFEGFKKLSSESIDHIIADPPYNVGQKFVNDNLSKEDYLVFMERWIRECYRVLKKGGCFFMFHYAFGMWDIKPILDKFDWDFLNLIIWSYPNMMPSNKSKKNRFPLSYQPIFFFGKNFDKDLHARIYKMSFSERKDVWTITAPQSNYKNNRRFHPCSKPLKLIEKIILSVSDQNDIILDPFSGSGTVSIVCLRHNRKFIAFEIDKKFYELSMSRLKKEITQKRLEFWK